MGMKMHTNKVITFLALISLVIISGCLTPGQVDCGSDESCFADAVQTCSPAAVRTAEKQETFGELRVNYIISGSVKGKEGNTCVVEEKIEELEMTGNLTASPSRLIYLLYSIVDSPITCKISGPVELDMNGIRRVSGQCTGQMLDLLNEAFAYKEGTPENITAKKIEVLESFCVGGKKVIVYIRNIGTESCNLSTDLKLVNSSTLSEIPVAWKDFTGEQTIDLLQPYEMAQFSLEAEPGNLYSYALILDSKSYPVSVQC
jgi:hypothetical protein